MDVSKMLYNQAMYISYHEESDEVDVYVLSRNNRGFYSYWFGAINLDGYPYLLRELKDGKT